VYYRRSVSPNEAVRLAHITPIHIHMFRKLPAIVAYSKAQQWSGSKSTTFLLRKGELNCSLQLQEQKTVYFISFHNIPVSFDIQNLAGFRIHDVRLRLCQELFYRTTATGRAILMHSHAIWEADLSQRLNLPISKGSTRQERGLSIPLSAQELSPTTTKGQKSLFFFQHHVELVIRTPKDVTDVILQLPITLAEPPIEHLAKAIHNRALAQAQSLLPSDPTAQTTSEDNS
jgi:hypothetical protein